MSKKKYTIILLMNSCISLLIIFLYHFLFSPKIIVFDYQGYLSNIKNEYVLGTLSDEDVDKKILKLSNLESKLSSNEIMLEKSQVIAKGKMYEEFKN